jgi:hypothetical protein
VEQELKLNTILYESFTKEEESPEGLRDVYLAFVKKGTKPKDKDWRKFRTPEDVYKFGKK